MQHAKIMKNPNPLGVGVGVGVRVSKKLAGRGDSFIINFLCVNLRKKLLRQKINWGSFICIFYKINNIVTKGVGTGAAAATPIILQKSDFLTKH